MQTSADKDVDIAVAIDTDEIGEHDRQMIDR